MDIWKSFAIYVLNCILESGEQMPYADQIFFSKLIVFHIFFNIDQIIHKLLNREFWFVKLTLLCNFFFGFNDLFSFAERPYLLLSAHDVRLDDRNMNQIRKLNPDSCTFDSKSSPKVEILFFFL